MAYSLFEFDNSLHYSGSKKPAPDLQLSELRGFSPHIVVLMFSSAFQAFELFYQFWCVGTDFSRLLGQEAVRSSSAKSALVDYLFLCCWILVNVLPFSQCP